MRPLFVIILHILPNSGTGFMRLVILFQVNILVFDSAPEPFDKDVVKRPSAVIHADFSSGVKEQVYVLRACERLP